MGNHHDRLILQQYRQGILYQCFTLGIHRSSCFIKQDNGSIFQQGAGNRNALTLATGQGAAVFPDVRLIPLRETLDKFLALGSSGRSHNFLISGIAPAQPHDPAVLQEALRQEQHSRGRAVPGDFKAHVTALHDSRIETEARRIVDKLKDLSAPNSPNKTHFMVEISPHFDALASTKDNDRIFAMLPYKSLCFTSIKDRHGVYAMINKDERRDVSIRKPRPSIRKQLADSKQATSPKKAAARTKKNELEV